MTYEELIKEYKRKYTPRIFPDFYNQKYSVKRNERPVDDEHREDRLIFSGDSKNIIHLIRPLIDNAVLLSKEFKRILGEEGRVGIYHKLMRSFINDLNEMYDECLDETCEEIAKRYKKILESSLFKCFACEQIKDCIDKYLLDCRLIKHTYEIGDLLRDEDYKYIGEPLMIPVQERERINRVLGKKHDSYEFGYYDTEDDEEYPLIICGEYEIGVRRER